MLISSKTMQSERNDFMVTCYRMRAHYDVPHKRIRGKNGNIRKDVRNRITNSTEHARQDWHTVY